MEPFSFCSTTALIAEEADRFDVEASLNEATLWLVLMVCKENIVLRFVSVCKCRLVQVCAGKVTWESALEWEKAEKNSWFRGSPSSLERIGENA